MTTAPQRMLSLRPYQSECIDAVTEAIVSDGIKRPAVVLPTGSGKTVIFAHMISDWLSINPGQKVCVLVHRDELAQQAMKRIQDVAPHLSVGLVKAERNELDHDVIVASVQTASRRSRLEQLWDIGIGLVIVDEAHHSAAPTWQRVLTGLGCFDDETPAVGFTATMTRADRLGGLGDIWQEVVYQRDILDMITDGWLVDPVGKMVTVDDLSLEDVRVSQGDYSPASLTEMLLQSRAISMTCDAIEQHAAGRSTLLFAPTVAGAYAFSAELRNRGITTDVVHGAQDPGMRKDLIRRFDAGQIQVLANCMVLTEGFDSPRASCVVIARPTRSASLYIQMVGRVLRMFPGKENALVLDVVGATQDHTLATLIDLSSRRIPDVRPGETLTEAATRAAKNGIPALTGYVSHRDVVLLQRSPIRWMQTTAGIWFIAGEFSYYFLWPTGADDTYKVGICPKTEQGGRWIRDGVSLESALEWAAQTAVECEPSYMTARGASWRRRREPVSEWQVRKARGLGLVLPDGITKRDASDRIEIALASRRLDWVFKGGDQA